MIHTNAYIHTIIKTHATNKNTCYIHPSIPMIIHTYKPICTLNCTLYNRFVVAEELWTLLPNRMILRSNSTEDGDFFFSIVIYLLEKVRGRNDDKFGYLDVNCALVSPVRI